MPAYGPQTRGADHELVILAHLVQMVKAVRNIPDEYVATKLGVTVGAASQMLSESARLTFEQLRQLFLAVGLTTEGIFETQAGAPERTILTPAGFGNAIEQGLEILNEEAPEEEGLKAAGT